MARGKNLSESGGKIKFSYYSIFENIPKVYFKRTINY
jgi:hypothetical protein